MTDVGTAKIVVVETKPAWQSKIIWTQIVGALLSLLTTNAFGFEPATQATILAITSVAQSILTAVLKTWFTNTITPSSMPAAPASMG